MKYFLIHGDDAVKSSDRLAKFISEARKRDWEVVFLDDSPRSIPENRFLIHRDLKKITINDLGWIGQESENYDGYLVLYADSLVPKTSINKLPKNIKIEEYKLPILIWKLLDSFYPGNSSTFLKLLHEACRTEPIELVFELLSRLLKDIYIVTTDQNMLSYPSWKISKLKSQANKFQNVNVRKLISDFAEADIKSKTSEANLIDSLDLITVSTLK